MRAFRYTECGLDNVLVEGLDAVVDDDDEEVITIPNINGLHKAIALGIVQKTAGLNGKELRYLRTELGMTQAQLGDVVHREPLTISRWERGEDALDSNAETIIRMIATEQLQLPTTVTVTEVAGWCVAGAHHEPLVIDGSDPSNYRVKAAA
jgi:DNA-binding transcriptional regulator YiaG